jgi:hypothetical protein
MYDQIQSPIIEIKVEDDWYGDGKAYYRFIQELHDGDTKLVWCKLLLEYSHHRDSSMYEVLRWDRINSDDDGYNYKVFSYNINVVVGDSIPNTNKATVTINRKTGIATIQPSDKSSDLVVQELVEWVTEYVSTQLDTLSFSNETTFFVQWNKTKYHIDY